MNTETPGIDRMITLLKEDEMPFVQSMEILVGTYCAMRLAVKYIKGREADNED